MILSKTRTHWPERGCSRALCVCRLSHPHPPRHTTQLNSPSKASKRLSFPCPDHRLSLGRSPKLSVVGRTPLLPISDLSATCGTIQPFPQNAREMHNLPRRYHIISQIGIDPSPTPATPTPVHDRILYLHVGATWHHSLCLGCK